MVYKVYATEICCNYEDQRDFTIAFCKDEQAAEILRKYYEPDMDGMFLVRVRPEINEQKSNIIEKMMEV